MSGTTTKNPLNGLARLNLGQDSEFFLWDAQKEEVVPSYLFYPQKEQAFVRFPNSYSKSFRDGLAVEVNCTPHSCRAYIIDWTREALVDTIPKALKKLPHIVFSGRPYVEITKKLIKQFPPDLLTLGCNPTLDVYNPGPEKVLKVNPKTLLYRTSGSHLHMSFSQVDEGGWPRAIPTVPVELWTPWVKACDLFLGVPFAYLFNDSLEFKRRQLYGQAGEFRHQQYGQNSSGLEYRVLSSRLWNHPALTSLFLLIFKYINGNIKFVTDGLKWDPAWEDDIREAINLGTPSAIEKGMQLWAENYPGVTHYDGYLLGPQPLASKDEGLNFWKKAKRIANQTKDAEGIDPNVTWKGAHYGWNEYLKNEFSTV